jgi:outer membrane protein TolC
MTLAARLLLAASIAAVGSLAAVSRAQTPSAEARGAPLRLDPEVVRSRAVERSPEVLSARVAQAQARHVRASAQRVLSFPPRVEVDLARRSYPGGAGADLAASLWQDFPLGGYGSAREAAAEARVSLRNAELELARRDALRRAMQAWIDARLGRDLLATRHQSELAAEQLVQIAQTRVSGGKDSPIDLALARSVLGAARAAVLDAEGRIVEADASLRYALGLDPSQPVDVVGDLRVSDDRPIDEAATIAAAQGAHPWIAIAELQAVSADRHAEVVASVGRPMLGVGLSYAREATGDRIFGGAVSIPIPVANPQSFEVAAAHADAAELRARVQEIRSRLAAEVRLAIHERDHAREVRDALFQGAVLPGRDALQALVARYGAGAVDLATVVAARRELFHAEESWMEAAADVHRADLRLEHAVGGPLPRRSAP